MQRFGCLPLVALFTINFASSQSSTRSGGWISLFDGKSLDGWKASDKEGTFNVQDGMILVHGPRSHLYYVGPVGNHDFKNFELKADVMTTPGSNSGIYFHTAYQDQGCVAKPLFQTSIVTFSTSRYLFYDATADGQRFIINTVPGGKDQTAINIVVNWQAELKRN